MDLRLIEDLRPVFKSFFEPATFSSFFDSAEIEGSSSCSSMVAREIIMPGSFADTPSFEDSS